tara:strand:- start:612 stop:953 length:342 start_codon:yes stop_codon:yes gene_type:complete
MQRFIVFLFLLSTPSLINAHELCDEERESSPYHNWIICLPLKNELLFKRQSDGFYINGKRVGHTLNLSAGRTFFYTTLQEPLNIGRETSFEDLWNSLIRSGLFEPQSILCDDF